jgi:hypothetical protein
LLPRRIVSGERATLAVLDVNGRLTPGVSVDFSNGDHLTTDATGRALFVASLNQGVISAAISNRPGRVYTTILSPTEAASSAADVGVAPRVASLSDRFEISGRGFCGPADSNRVTVAGHKALVLASSPMSLVVLPPPETDPGAAQVSVGCGKSDSPTFGITFVSLALEADSRPLSPNEHRTLTVRVTGTSAKVMLEARNLAPDIAEVAGGNPAKVASSGGADNAARFELTGKHHGSFLISIHLVPTQTRLHP